MYKPKKDHPWRTQRVSDRSAVTLKYKSILEINNASFKIELINGRTMYFPRKEILRHDVSKSYFLIPQWFHHKLFGNKGVLEKYI